LLSIILLFTYLLYIYDDKDINILWHLSIKLYPCRCSFKFVTKCV